MATETVLTPPIATTDEKHVEKKVSEEEKVIEEGGVPLTKESGEEILKTDDSICLETPPESEAVIHQKFEPPVVEAEKIDVAPVSDIPVVGETKAGDDPIPDILEQVVLAEKNADAAVSDVSLVEKSPLIDPIPDTPEQVVDVMKIPEEVIESSTVSVIREAPTEPALEIIEEGQVEQTNIVDAPQSSYEAIEKTEEPLQVTTDKESVETVLTDIKESEPESLKVEKPKLATAGMEEKPGEPCEVTEEVETKQEEVELEKSVHDETMKDEGSAADKVETISFSENQKSDAENTPSLQVEEKPAEPCEFTQEVERKLEEVELEKSVHGETVKEEGSAADKVEPISFSEEVNSETYYTPCLEVDEAPEQRKVEEEEKIHDEVGPEICLKNDIVKDEDVIEASSILEEAQTAKDYEPQVKIPEEILLNGDGISYYLPDTTEAPASEDQKKDVTEVDVVDKLQEESAVEIEKVGGEVLETKETEKEIAATEPIKEEEKAGLIAIEVVEKPAEETSVKLGTVGEENVETLEIEEKVMSNVVTEASTQPVESDKKKELSGVDVVEKLAEEELVKLKAVGEENVESLEIEEKEKSNVITEELTQPIELNKEKELSGLDAVEKLTEEAAVEVQKVGEKNVEIEDAKSVVTEDTIQPILEDEHKDLTENDILHHADVIEKLADETVVKVEEVGEENMDKIAETKECEKKDEIIEDSSQPILGDQKKEASAVDVVEKLAEDVRVKFDKVGEASKTKNVQYEDSDSKNVLDEVLTQPDKADVNSYIITPSEVIEKSFEGAEKDIEPVAETEKAEHINDETPGTIETKKEDNVEEKQDEVAKLVAESLGESKPSEPEVKGDEPVTVEKTIENVAKSDKNIELPTKDGGDTKPSEDLQNEVPAKTSQKQSNTIYSKVKQTLVKAKRVITGKSPSSKTPASEAKDDIIVK
ncbi:uncharacterized protein LOC126798055 [Argentina anserina]|uniref:uncharacterized protein LOC126798055 n=1 Tax=Argentina anserina TaxID=57926 RepID=UPI0021768A4C|nr:uncharacterized protein LOC126798055 [Potentilla anserina]